jgi:hypothetical protein
MNADRLSKPFNTGLRNLKILRNHPEPSVKYEFLSYSCFSRSGKHKYLILNRLLESTTQAHFTVLMIENLYDTLLDNRTDNEQV